MVSILWVCDGNLLLNGCFTVLYKNRWLLLVSNKVIPKVRMQGKKVAREEGNKDAFPPYLDGHPI